MRLREKREKREKPESALSHGAPSMRVHVADQAKGRQGIVRKAQNGSSRPMSALRQAMRETL